jgi:four helix bundle protein
MSRAMKQRFRFEKLEVWQDARAFNREVCRLAREFPREEKHALTAQVCRASSSVAANIAEGSGRNSDPDSARFLEQAFGSLMETASHLYLAPDENYINETGLDPVLEHASALAGRIVVLNRSLTVTHTKTPFARNRTASPSTLATRPSTPLRS